jgi:SAM-dependent methyltransferase
VPDDWFDEMASEYDVWFQRNQRVLESEVRLLAHLLGPDPGRTLSVGCGTGLFELILRREHGIDVGFGVEPALGMATVARARGLEVHAGTAEALPLEAGSFDTVVMNGIPSYVDDLERAVSEAKRVLRPGGRLVMLDVPAESSYGLLYRLAAEVGDWDDDFLSRVAPEHPYPIEFAKAANWRTTEEKLALFRQAGFEDLYVAQTLTRHPKFSDDEPEDPSQGFERGDYVGIRGARPR